MFCLLLYGVGETLKLNIMSILEEFISLFDVDREDKAKRKAEAKSKHIAEEMRERIQIKEYKGKMYISVDNIPMIDTEHLSIDTIDALSKIRNTITEYKCHTT